MTILDSLRKEKWGVWKTNDELFTALRARDVAALSALAAVLGLEASEQKELAFGEGAEVLTGVVADLRQQKGARLAAARCCIEAQLPPEKLATLFLCAADLLTDPRLGGKARVLAETGLTAALAKREDLHAVGQPAGDFARGAQAAASVLGTARVKELLAAAPPAHSGALAALFAIGEELPAGAKESWEKVLVEQCAANRKAPAAAKRMGLAVPWPPFLPDAFAPLIKFAEEQTATVVTTDALAKGPTRAGAPTAMPSNAAGSQAARGASRAAPGADFPTTAGKAAPESPQRRTTTEYLGTRKMEAPIQRQRSRQAGAQLEEKPVVHETRSMPPVVGRPPTPEGLVPDMDPVALAARAAKAGVAPEALAETERLASRLPANVLAALAADRGIVLPDGRFYKGDEPLRFDPQGKRIPRVDRWDEFDFEWQDPVLPASELRAPIRAQPLSGPFASRLKSLYEDRPEAVERLCAAAEARAAISGEEKLLTELTLEMASARWRGKRISAGQRARLIAVVDDAARPSSWRRCAESILAMDARPRAAGEH